MGFMQRQITTKRTWIEIDGTQGTTFVDAEDVSADELAIAVNEDASVEDFQETLGDYYEGKIWTVTTREGYGARLSAPGYMDRTEWSVFDTVGEAESHLEEFYGDDDEDETDED